MGLPVAVRSVLKREHAKIPMHYPNRPDGGARVGAARRRLVQEAISTGKLNPTSRRILKQVVADMRDGIMLREAQFERESKVHRVDAKDAFDKKLDKRGSHKSYDEVRKADQTYVAQAKKTIQQIETALKQ